MKQHEDLTLDAILADAVRLKALLHEEILTIEDMALMYRITPSGVRKKIYRGELTGRKNGRRWYFRKSVVMGTEFSFAK